MGNSMRIIGIDPGYAIVGWGVVDYGGGKFRTVAYGAITTGPELSFARRLECIWDDLSAILCRYRPQEMAVEKLFFTTNQKTAIDVAQARGIVQLCAVKHGVELAEYTPLQVKQSVVGYGKAEKNQVMQMTKSLLSLEKVPKLDDTADALAVAICHAHSAVSNMGYRNLMKMR